MSGGQEGVRKSGRCQEVRKVSGRCQEGVRKLGRCQEGVMKVSGSHEGVREGRYDGRLRRRGKGVRGWGAVVQEKELVGFVMEEERNKKQEKAKKK